MASASLSRATSDPQSSNTTATFSVWIKRSGLGSDQTFWGGSYYSTDNMFILKFSSDDKLQVYSKRGASVKASLKTTRVLRDTSAWYHIVIGIDTSQGSAADRIKVYINGVQETSFSTNTQPSQDENLYLDSGAGANYYIGQRGGNAEYFDGQMAHFHYADGTTYTPTTFGETDSTTGIWKPKTAPTVNYGNKGVFLKFDNSANMGLDSSGSSRNFTTSGTIIQAKDTPTNVFCTNNELWSQESTRILNLSNINNTLSGAGSATWYQVPGTLSFSKGKYYWECKFNSSTNLDKNTPGVMDIEKTNDSGQFQDKTGSVFYKNEDGGETRIDASTSTADYGTLAQNDILGVAVDMDAGTPTVKFYKNGSLLVTANASSFSGKTVTPAHMVYTSGAYQVNYGNGYFGTTAVSSAQNPDDGIGVFEYSVPSGYKALCTKSINAQEYS